jgi:hypothetical protein
VWKNVCRPATPKEIRVVRLVHIAQFADCGALIDKIDAFDRLEGPPDERVHGRRARDQAHHRVDIAIVRLPLALAPTGKTGERRAEMGPGSHRGWWWRFALDEVLHAAVPDLRWRPS